MGGLDLLFNLPWPLFLLILLTMATALTYFQYYQPLQNDYDALKNLMENEVKNLGVSITSLSTSLIDVENRLRIDLDRMYRDVVRDMLELLKNNTKEHQLVLSDVKEVEERLDKKISDIHRKIDSLLDRVVLLAASYQTNQSNSNTGLK